MTGRGIHHAPSTRWRHLSPLLRRCGMLRVPLPATGRGCASVLHVAAAGARKVEPTDGSRSGRPGGNRFRQSVSNGAEPATALAAQGAMARKRRKPKLCPGTEIADAGAARSPGDPSRSRGAPQGVLKEVWPGLLGPDGTGPRVADEAPAYPSHPRPRRRGRTARGHKRSANKKEFHLQCRMRRQSPVGEMRNSITWGSLSRCWDRACAPARSRLRITMRYSNSLPSSISRECRLAMEKP